MLNLLSSRPFVLRVSTRRHDVQYRCPSTLIDADAGLDNASIYWHLKGQFY